MTASYLPSRFFAGVDDAMTTPTTPPLDAIFASAIGRCSLVRVAFRVVAEGRTHGNLAEMALRNGSFEDLMTTGDALAHVVDTIATVRHSRRRCECER